MSQDFMQAKVGQVGVIGWELAPLLHSIKKYRPFTEALAFVRNLDLKSYDEWRAWYQTNARPDDIPANPSNVYKDEGWGGYGDWLGTVNLWNRNAILSFLYGIKPILPNLEPAELFAIIRQNGLIAAIRLGNSNAQFVKNIRDLCSSPNREGRF